MVGLAGAVLLSTPGAEGALDAVQLWDEEFSGQVKVIRDGAVVGITATDLVSTGGTRTAWVSDPTNPGDGINVTLYDDGTHGDAAANDGIYTGNFTVRSDGGSSGSLTDEAAGVVDIAEGDPVSVYVDLDGDGSHSEMTVSTDFTGPEMATPFTGGYVHGDLIITITIIIEGEAPLDPASVTYSVDSGLPAMFTQIAPDTFQATIDTYLLVDGPHTVSTLSMDEAGNIGMGTFDIIVDNTVPDIMYVCTTIASNGDVLIDTSVSDLHLDTTSVRWNWDGGDWVFPSVPGNDILFTVTIPYDDIVPGEHGTTVVAEDLAGNSMTLITRWILPEQDFTYLVVDPIVIDPYLYIGCETLPIPVDLLNKGDVPLDLEYSLVVDYKMIENKEMRLNAGTLEKVYIDWTGVMPGLHDVQMVITHVKDPGTGNPKYTIDVLDPDGNPLFMLPDPFKILALPPIDEADAYSGNTVKVTPIIVNWQTYSQKAIVQLVVDGKVVDTVSTDIPAMTNHTVELEWKGLEQGDHDVEVRVFQPDSYGSEEPVDTKALRNNVGGPVHIDWPDSFKILYTPPIDFSKTKPGEDVKVEPIVTNFEDSPRRAVVQLLVDGVVVDTVNTDIPALTNKTFELDWPMVTEGDHEVEIRVYDPDWYGIDNPVHISTVENSAGGPIHIDGSQTVKDDDKTPVDRFLDAFEPINNYLPLEWVPESIRPWTFPLILIGSILIIAVVAGTRRKPKEKDVPAKEPEIKPVQMPPVTATPATPAVTATKPTPDLEDGFPDRPKDEGKVIPLTGPGVFTTDVPDGGTTGKDGGRPAPLDSPGVPAKAIPLASWQSTDPSTATTPETPSTGTTTTKGPDKPPALVPPIVPPIASTTGDEGKGKPCVDIIEAYDTAARGVSDAKDKADDAQEEADRTDLAADDAEEKAREAQKECDDAKREYEGEGVGDAEKEAKKAEDRIKEMEDRMRELEGEIPPVDGVSTEPRPGYSHGGVGFGEMVHVTHVYYRDNQAEIDLNRELKKRFREYKDLKKEMEDVKEKAQEARKRAEDLAGEAKDAKRKLDEACEKARKAREEAERLRRTANDAQENATALAGQAAEAAEAAEAANEASATDGKKVNDCKDCLAKVKRTKARIEELKRQYESLKGGSQMEGPRNRYDQMDPQGAWDQWWNSFKQFRDEAKRLFDMKSFAEAGPPEEYDGVWDWGGPVGTAVGYAAEDIITMPLPADTVKAVGPMFRVFQGMFNPKYIMGGKILRLHLTEKEAGQAEQAFKSFPKLMERAIQSFEKLMRLVELDSRISDAFSRWRDCLGRLPAAPDTPKVDMDKLCYKQCLDKLKELEEAEKKLRELIGRAKACRPDGLDDMFAEGNRIKGQLNGMRKAMDRCRDGLGHYRRAHRANLGIDD